MNDVEVQLESLREEIRRYKKKESKRHKKLLDRAQKELLKLEQAIERKKQDEEDRRLLEVTACMESFPYFVNKYCYIYDSGDSKAKPPRPPGYIPFHLWPGQEEAVKAVCDCRLLVLLKARQLGMTWLCLAYALWMMTFRRDVNVLLFSLKENEAYELVDRLTEMWRRLPEWMRVPGRGLSGSLSLDNGSIARAFSTAGGDSYNATLAIIDEADLVPDLDRLMRRVKPTIDAGGKLFLVSRVDKKYPTSHFKEMYRAIKRGALTDWNSVFLPWHARPERDAAWYKLQVDYSLETTGSLDSVHEQYPATDAEALAANTLDKRIPGLWLDACFKEMKHLSPFKFKPDAPSIPQMRVYVYPDPKRSYVIGADPAQGNPNSDDSAMTVLDKVTGEECCNVVGKFEPAIFASMIDKVARWFKCPVMVERNNHGHAVILWLNDHGRCRVLSGPDEEKGFYTTSALKIIAYDSLVEAFRGRNIVIHDTATYYQLASIESATLRAPETMFDDRAMSVVLANYARAGVVNYKNVPKPEIKPEHSVILANKERIFG